MLINQLKIPEDERVIQLEKVKNLFIVYKKGYLTQGEIEQIFEEWKDISRRLSKGKMIIDERQRNTPKQNVEQLVDLYQLLVRMASIYCGFFEEMLKEKPEIFRRMLNEVVEEIK